MTFSKWSIFGELFIHIFREREKFICIKSDERGIQEEMTDPKLAELPIEKEYSGLLIFCHFLGGVHCRISSVAKKMENFNKNKKT